MLNRAQRKQVPFATALALTQTAKDVKKAEDIQISKKLDRPTKFTRNAIALTPATKRNLTATIFVKDAQIEYLKYQIYGGKRVTRGVGTGVPTKNKKLNTFGNIAGRKRGLVKGNKQFIATIKGITGVWARTGGKKKQGVKLLVAFEKEVSYKKRFPFFKIANGVARNKFPRNFNKALERAFATMR